MSGALGMPIRATRRFIVIAALAFSIFAHAQSANKISSSGGAKEKLIGAWHLVRIDAPGPDGKSMPIPQPKGMLIYTRDGHMSVQLMYPESANTLSNEYVLNGYEASFGSYDVDEVAHTVTHHVQGSITRDLLVGKDLLRKYEFTADGHLIIRSARPDEHWFVTWEHD
jgi:Lipocalin-like domain